MIILKLLNEKSIWSFDVTIVLSYYYFRNGSFGIIIEFRQTRYTDKRQVPAYTFDDLVGACGGYIGLFLGYAFIQFPHLLEFMFNILKRNFCQQKLTIWTMFLKSKMWYNWHNTSTKNHIKSLAFRIWFHKNIQINTPK